MPPETNVFWLEALNSQVTVQNFLHNAFWEKKTA